MAIPTLVDHVGHFRCASSALSRSSLASLFVAYSRPFILGTSLLGAVLCPCGYCAFWLTYAPSLFTEGLFSRGSTADGFKFQNYPHEPDGEMASPSGGVKEVEDAFAVSRARALTTPVTEDKFLHVGTGGCLPFPLWVMWHSPVLKTSVSTRGRFQFPASSLSARVASPLTCFVLLSSSSGHRQDGRAESTCSSCSLVKLRSQCEHTTMLPQSCF